MALKERWDGVARPALPSLAARAGGFVRACLAGPLDIAITLGVLGVLAWVVPPFVQWAILDATWSGNARACRAAGGACSAFIRGKFRFSVFGLQPLRGAVAPGDHARDACRDGRSEHVAKPLEPQAADRLVPRRAGDARADGGGVFGLASVATRLWGGTAFSGIIAVFWLASGYPLAIVLALGRRSALPLVRWISKALIEVVRGVPLISLLFVAAIMLPLFLPRGGTLDPLIRIIFAYTVFSAAYMAEVIRVGLREMPRGQYEAAGSLGPSCWQRTRLVILRRALTITVPAQVNTFIGLFKDNTLVVVIGVFDLFTTLRAAPGDPRWLGFPTGAYPYAALVFVVPCFAMSRPSPRLERRLRPEGAR